VCLKPKLSSHCTCTCTCLHLDTALGIPVDC
jgi:hypothetical protein